MVEVFARSLDGRCEKFVRNRHFQNVSKMGKELLEILWVRLANNLVGDRSKKAKKKDGQSVVTRRCDITYNKQGEELKWTQHHEVI